MSADTTIDPAATHGTLRHGTVQARRRLGLGAAVALTVGNVVGVGIFLTPSEVAAASPSTLVYIGFWLLGGVVALAGALATAELGSLFPRAGGDYVFLDEAFGRPLAFAWGWLSVFATFSGSIAAYAIGAMDTLASTSWGGGLSHPALTVGPLTLAPKHLIAAAVVWGITVAHCRSVGLISRIQLLLTWAPISAFLLTGLWVLFSGAGAPPPAVDAAPARTFELGLASAAFCAVFFTYSGWNVLTYVGGEVKTPGRTIPGAILCALLATGVIYLLLNVIFLRTLSLEQLGEVANAGVAATRQLFGPAGADVFALLLTCSIIAALNVTAMAGSRIVLAMARHGYLWRRMAEIHPRRGTPAVALLVQGAWTTVLVLTGSFETLATFTGAAMILLSCLTVSTLFVFRRRQGGRGRSRFGYPWAPALFIFVGVVVLAVGAASTWIQLLGGMGAFAALAGFEAWRQRRARR